MKPFKMLIISVYLCWSRIILYYIRFVQKKMFLVSQEVFDAVSHNLSCLNDYVIVFPTAGQLHKETKLPEKLPWCSGKLHCLPLVCWLLCISKHSITEWRALTPQLAVRSYWPLSHSLLLSYWFLHRKYSRVERECRQGDCMLALKKTPLRQWLEPGQVFWPGRSLHVIDLAFVLADLTPVAHKLQYIKHRQQTVHEASLHQSACRLDEAVISVWVSSVPTSWTVIS